MCSSDLFNLLYKFNLLCEFILLYDFIPTTFMLRVSFSPVPECVEIGLLESSFSDPPAAPGTPLLLLLLLLLLFYTLLLNLFIGSYSYFALGPFFSSGTQLLLHNDIIYKKVIYNIGTEILIFTSNLHSAAHNAPISMIFSGVCTKFRALSF